MSVDVVFSLSHLTAAAAPLARGGSQSLREPQIGRGAAPRACVFFRVLSL